jgi:hypothetical protein
MTRRRRWLQDEIGLTDAFKECVVLKLSGPRIIVDAPAAPAASSVSGKILGAWTNASAMNGGAPPRLPRSIDIKHAAGRCLAEYDVVTLEQRHREMFQLIFPQLASVKCVAHPLAFFE